MVLTGKIIDVYSDQEKEARRQLIGMRNKLNQLAKLVHSRGLETQLTNIDSLIDHFDNIIDKYNYVSKGNK